MSESRPHAPDAPETSGDTDRIAEVRLPEFPLRLWAAAQQHVDELLREFTLLSMGEESGESAGHTPTRLLALIHELNTQYAGTTTETDAVRDAALTAGHDTMELVYQVPAAAREACIRLGEMLDAADDFCRDGDYLLTLATPLESLLFRRWYLDQFVHQIDGAGPVSWPQYRAAQQHDAQQHDAQQLDPQHGDTQHGDTQHGDTQDGDASSRRPGA